MHSDEGLIFLLKYRPINVVTVWIWSVEYDDGFIIFSSGFHDIVHGRNVGVESNADILNIKYQNI